MRHREAKVSKKDKTLKEWIEEKNKRKQKILAAKHKHFK